MRHESTRINTSPARINQTKKLPWFIVALVYGNSLIGLNYFVYSLFRARIKINQEQIGEISRSNPSFRK